MSTKLHLPHLNRGSELTACGRMSNEMLVLRLFKKPLKKSYLSYYNMDELRGDLPSPSFKTVPQFKESLVYAYRSTLL
jgi:hypothetical protein